MNNEYIIEEENRIKREVMSNGWNSLRASVERK